MKRFFGSKANRASIRVIFVMLLCTGTASAQDLPPAAMAKARQLAAAKLALSPEELKLESNLYDVLQKLRAAEIRRENATQKNVAAAFATPLLQIDAGGRLHLILRTTEITPALLAQLAALEFEVESTTANLPVTPNHQMIAGWAPFDRIGDLAKLSPIFHIRPVDRPIAMRASGEVTTAGDAILRANLARSTFGVDGAGQKVGVLSLGVDHIVNSQASADLPATVDIINNRNRGDEGTAMLEIIHDLAPGASLAFADAGLNPVDFANNITLLANAGCTILCDDLIYFSEPFYEDGVIAQTVDNVANARNIVYTSAAGNHQLDHHEGDFLDTDSDGNYNFASSDETMDIELTPNSTIQAVLQWNSPFGKAADDYDLFIYDATVSTILAASTNRQNGDDDPFELALYTNTTAATIIVKLVVVKIGGSNRRLTIVTYGSGFTPSGEGVRPLEFVNVDGAVYGHAAAQGCLAVGAINASDPGNDDIQTFSARGPSRIYSYDANGNPIGFVDRPKPDHVAIDVVETKTGRLGFFFNPFGGTSAAAAHTAGIAALFRQKNPSLPAAEVNQALNRTAVDLGAAGFDRIFGNGRIDALNALRIPTAATNAAANVTSTSAVLNATVNANGLSTTVKFQYGPTTSYGSEMAASPSPLTGLIAVAVSATVTGLSANTTYNYRVVATNSAGTTNGANQTFTTPARVNQPPSIAHTPPGAQPENRDINIEANLSDDTGILSAQVRYRSGGEANFSSTPMMPSGGTYRGAIPASAANSRGVEYFIEATDTDNAMSRRPPAPNFFSTPIQVSRIENPSLQRSGSAATDYRLISVPMRLNDSSATAVLADNLEAYDNTKWRLYDLGARLPVATKNSYVEVSQTGFFSPGKSLFLIVKAPNLRVDAGPGQSVRTDQEFSITLQPGHNFIASPFNFANTPIPVSKLRLQSGGAITLRTYDRTWVSSSSLSPWEGYYLANNNTTPDILFVDPNLSPPTPSPKITGGTKPLSGWRVQILAACAQASDTENFAGVFPASHDGWDDNDLAEPPPIGEYVSVYFPHPEWQKPLNRFSDDMRSPSNPNQRWRFVVESNISNEMVMLRFDGLPELDPVFAVFLVDEELKNKQNLREKATYQYQARCNEAAKEFTLIVGKENFIAEQTANVAGAPENFVLEQNFPNPFGSTEAERSRSPETAIRFGLPQASVVTIKIFDLAGHEVATLVDRAELPAGRHQRVWDGRDLQGRLAASGIYFYQLRAGNFARTLKLMLMR